MSEVHFETAKNSELIFTLAGRHLCSSVQPSREAQQWISYHQSLWENCQTVIVLGLGCGYHVRALKMATDANILVLDSSRAVIEAALRVHPLDFRDSDIIFWDSVQNLSFSKPLIAATKNAYAVLIHEPSAFENPDLFLTTKAFLLGRKAEGLRWLFQNRGLPIPEFIDGTEINMTTLDGVWHRQLAGNEHSQPVMQALRELIA